MDQMDQMDQMDDFTFYGNAEKSILSPLPFFLKRYLTKKFFSAILNKIFVASVQK